MHNTPRENLEFSLTFSETNLRYLLAKPKTNKKIIQTTKRRIQEIKDELSKLLPMPSTTSVIDI